MLIIASEYYLRGHIKFFHTGSTTFNITSF